MDLSIERVHRVLHITLNRPGKRNALSAAMCSAINTAVDGAQDDPEIGAILFCAAGPVFSAGMDLDEALDADGHDLAAVHERLFTMGARSLKPIVVSVGGAALGGGLGLVAQGHIVIAAEGAAFGLPEVRIGLWPFLVYRAVEEAIGPRRTLELSLTGRIFHAEDAQQWGLVYQTTSSLETSDRAKALARELAKASPAAIRAGLTYARDAREKGAKEAGEIAAALRMEMMKDGDFREGIAAFKEKREPHWPSMPEHFYAGKGRHKRP